MGLVGDHHRQHEGAVHLEVHWLEETRWGRYRSMRGGGGVEDHRDLLLSISYLDHCQHALVGDGVGADGEVSRGISADDAVDGVPVGTVGLVPVHHSQVRDHHVDLVLWDLP